MILWLPCPLALHDIKLSSSRGFKDRWYNPTLAEVEGSSSGSKSLMITMRETQVKYIGSKRWWLNKQYICISQEGARLHDDSQGFRYCKDHMHIFVDLKSLTWLRFEDSWHEG